MARFIRRTLLALSPLLLLAVPYFWCDPFKVLRNYDHFYAPGDSVWVNLNADYVSTSLYDAQWEQQGYDALIFGNSRSRYYPIADWLSHLPQGRSGFHWDAHNESLYALTRKVEYVGQSGRPLRDALLVVDRDLLVQDHAATPHLNYISPRLEGNTLTARLGFQCAFLKAWYTPKFIFAYADARLSNRLKPYMMREAMLMAPYPYDPHTNEEYMAHEEARIAAGTYYDEPEILARFAAPQRPGEEERAVIGKRQRALLQRIRKVFDERGTDYRIVVSPLYDQVRLNPADVSVLREVFGRERVFDFSGDNAITRDRHNYYERYHYRPCAARIIMDSVYAKPLP